MGPRSYSHLIFVPSTRHTGLSCPWARGRMARHQAQGKTVRLSERTRRTAHKTAERTNRTRKPRAISKARLWRRRLYTCLLSTSSSRTTLNGVLISRPASHLDAFSAYPFQTRIPGGAPGGTTGIPEVCPARSSRTSARSTQDSCAHDR